MLTSAQERYIDWYFMHRNGKTIAEIAAGAEVDTRSVDRGLAWCRKKNVGNRQDKAELEKRIADIHHDIKQIEQDIRRVRREIKKRDPTAAGDGPYLGLNNSLIGFRRELREHKKDLAELEGLLRRVVELDVPGMEKLVNVLKDGIAHGPIRPGKPVEKHDNDGPADD